MVSKISHEVLRAKGFVLLRNHEWTKKISNGFYVHLVEVKDNGYCPMLQETFNVKGKDLPSIYLPCILTVQQLNNLLAVVLLDESTEWCKQLLDATK